MATSVLAITFACRTECVGRTSYTVKSQILFYSHDRECGTVYIDGQHAIPQSELVEQLTCHKS